MSLYGKYYPFIVCISLGLLLSLLILRPSLAQEDSSFVRQVRKLEADRTGLSNPMGVVFSSEANVFHVIDARGNIGSSSSTVISNNSVFGHKTGSSTIDVGIENPINMAMDNKNDRLLIYQASSHQLVEIGEDVSGNLATNTMMVQDASFVGVNDPQGMTFDPIRGELYMLDAVGPRVIGVTLLPDGSIEGSNAKPMDLQWAGDKTLRGIAFDPSSGNFHVLDPVTQILYEFALNGGVSATRDLSGFHLSDPQGIFFAPSGDQTDDPAELSLYLVDSGNQANSSPTELMSNNITTSNTGKIVEFSLTQPAAYILADITATFTSTVVKETDTSLWSPPSPDPSGIAYINSRNTLLISDSDVEETKGGFTHFDGVNLWEVNLGGSVVNTANISLIPPTYVPMTDEPTGVAWNPGSGHYYFTDDNLRLVYELNPGIDGQYGTVDDSWTSFPTDIANGDPEGITYDSWHDRLFVIDGTNLEVYEYTLTGSLVNHFDLEVFGILDTESVEFNPISGTLYILSNRGNHTIVETTTTGGLIQTIDFSDSWSVNAAGLALAPASENPGVYHFYIVDRGVDNDFDPTENDGKMYEMTAPAPVAPLNTPPIVNAGIDQFTDLGTDVNLNGTATDDGNPNPPGALTTLWSVVSGPGSVTFGDPSALSTTASFLATGTYTLRLTASDSEFSIYDDIMVNVTASAGSSIFEERLLASSDDAEQSITGTVILQSAGLEMIYPSQIIGLRFAEINLPKTAVINNAYIQFEAKATNDVATHLTIKGEAQDNPGTFMASLNNISSRVRTATSATWDPAPWTQVNEAGVNQRTTNITSIVQELIHRPGWSADNAIAFIIDGTGFSLRLAWSYDGNRSGAPRLHIEYTLSPNHVPVAVNDIYSLNEDTPLSVVAPGVLDNDTDADGDPLTALKYTDPAHGTLTLNSDGSFVYTPQANYNGSDSFTYYVNDGELNSNIATVTLTINPVNDPPVAVNDSYATNEDTQLVVSAPGVLSNDINVDADTLAVATHTEPSHGTLVINSNGSFTYTPQASYNGSDSFTYKATDGLLQSNTATVSITINPVNDAPVAVNDSYTTNEDTPKVVSAPGVLLNDTDIDGDTLTVATHTEPSHGTLVINSNGSFTYTPQANYNGSDSFTYKATDGLLQSNTATVSITINAVNDPPVAVNDSYTTNEDAPKVVSAPGVLSNDSDIDGDTLTVASHTEPAHGTLVINSNGSFTYTPQANYNGSDSFTYKASDSLLESNTATVSITINPVNDLPVAVNDSYTTDEDTSLVVSAPGVLGNDTDIDEDLLSVSQYTVPNHGALTVNSNGSFTYVPNYHFSGTDSFTYVATDGVGNSNTAKVSISVRQTIFFIYMPIVHK